MRPMQLTTRRCLARGATALVVALSTLVLGCSNDDPQPDFAAKVGLHTITAKALNEAVQRGAELKAQRPNLSSTFSRANVLRYLIVNEWQTQEAIARGVKIPQGLDPDQRRAMVFEGLIQSLSATKHFPVTNREIRSYYIAHRTDFDKPAQRFAQVIEAKTQAQALRALHALRKGPLSAQSIRSRYGQGVPNVTDDRSGLIIINQGTNEFPTALEQAIFRAPKGPINGPIQADGVWYIYQIRTTTKPQPATLRQNKPAIKQLIQQHKFDQYIARAMKHLHTKYKPRTQCDDNLIVPECNNHSRT
jgi:parvulin-like peptidyl-prolyl isomerase